MPQPDGKSRRGKLAENNRATVYDVSRLSGVSTATVSRVFSDSSKVSQATCRRVLEASRVLNFSPSHAGRALARGRTGNLAVMLPEMASGFYAESLAGVDEVAAEHGLNTVAMFFGHGREAAAVLSRVIGENRADGLVLINPYASMNRLPSVKELPWPIVVLGRPVADSGRCTVSIDNAAGISAIVQHLYANGHRRIAVISGPVGTWDAEQRIKSYLRAMRKFELPVDAKLIWPGNFTLESGRHAMRKAIIEKTHMDAVVCLNDESAIGAIIAAQEAGLKIPDDIAITGFDDIAAAEGLQLTTVACPMRSLGRYAGDAVTAIIKEGGRPADRLVPVRLVVRLSSGPRISTGELANGIP